MLLCMFPAQGVSGDFFPNSFPTGTRSTGYFASGSLTGFGWLSMNSSVTQFVKRWAKNSNSQSKSLVTGFYQKYWTQEKEGPDFWVLCTFGYFIMSNQPILRFVKDSSYSPTWKWQKSRANVTSPIRFFPMRSK